MTTNTEVFPAQYEISYLTTNMHELTIIHTECSNANCQAWFPAMEIKRVIRQHNKDLKIPVALVALIL